MKRLKDFVCLVMKKSPKPNILFFNQIDEGRYCQDFRFSHNLEPTIVFAIIKMPQTFCGSRSSLYIEGMNLTCFYLCHGMNSYIELLLSSMPIKSFLPYVLFLEVVAFWIEWYSSCSALYFIEYHLCLDVWMDCALISGMRMKAIKRIQWLKAYCIFSVSAAMQRNIVAMKYQSVQSTHKQTHSYNLR